jgi:hypothetical protein
MSGRRVVAALLAMVLGAVMISVLPSSLPASAAAAPVTGDSSVTVSGKGEFANLKVTVSQTKNLINQTVTVSWTWTGGVSTQPSSGDFGVNYLQIMQCWGDDPNGSDRTQCQFGGSSTQNSPSAGSFVRSRQVNYGATLVDQKETIKQAAGSFQNVYVPFWAVGHPTPKPAEAALSDSNEFFDSQVTNEVPLGSTHGDGSGEESFEVETVREAAGLGCGEPVVNGATTTPRKCWLVIVPRGTTEVDGSTRSGNNVNRLDSSPLSETNWDNRLKVALEFQLVGKPCPIGAAERRVVGHELVADAVSSWQPALCAGGGALFGFTQLPDEVARSQVLDGTSPGLALVTNPIPPDQAPSDRPLVYAPVGLSGLAIAFNIERQPPADASSDKLQLDGQRFPSMKLTPRLVAKLLTQSYRGAVAGTHDYLKNNPVGLTVDPEFLDLNPDYKGFATFNQPPDALVQLNGSDVTSLLWSWVKADPEARAFITGTPDKFGMMVNPANKNLALPTSTFPRNDPSCTSSVDFSSGVTLTTCTLDTHPFTLDMHDAGRSASRGDTQARIPAVSGGIALPKKLERQDPGHQALLAVVDVTTAARYGLPTAALLNSAGQFVAPTTDSLLAGEEAMKPSAVAGLLSSDAVATDPAAYPLTALSYAVTSPSTLNAAAGKDYAAFLRYVGGPGQKPGIEPGQLPLGMVPLPETLKAQTMAAAAIIEAQAGRITAGPTSSAGASAGGAGARAAVGAGVAGTTSGATGTRATGGASTPQGVATPRASGPAPNVAQKPVARVGRTPSLPAPAVGALILVILIGGALAATSAPVMHLVSTGLRRRPRKEVMPAEQ